MKLTSAALASVLFAPLALGQSSAASAAASAAESAASGAESAAASATGSASMSAASSTASGMSTGGNGTEYLQTVLQALTAAGLTSLVGVASSIANTTEGMALLGQLSSGNKTVFAPNNDAFSAVPESVSSNTTLLTQILSYHILNNTYSGEGIATSPNHTIARTLLRGGNFRLPGNRTAPLVLERPANSSSSSNSSMSGNSTSNSTSMSSSQFRIVQANLTTPMGPAVAANLEVYVIDKVLDLPANLSTVATSAAPQLAGLVQQANLLQPLEAATGITVFAPNDAAISAVMSQLGQVTNATIIQNVLLNHVINGTAAYSTDLGTGNYTSAAGEPFMFSKNSTGSYVTSGNVTAMITAPDIIIENGVVHLIDGVLLNTMSNAAAASSAYESNTAAAATAAEQTGPVTAATSNPAASGSSSTGAGARIEPFGITGSMLGGAIGVMAAVLGGAFVLV